MVPLLVPEQTAGSDETLPCGLGFTLMVILAGTAQPFAAVPVTVYVVVVPGYAHTPAPVVTERSVAGLQLYVLAPAAVRKTLSPLQIVAEDGVTLMVGDAFIVIAREAEFEQPLEVTV